MGALVRVAAGFFAFYLWLTVRSRLFQNATHAIVQYTLLLLLFGVAVYKSVNVPFLAVTLGSEISSVFLLSGKLLHLAGELRPGALQLDPSRHVPLISARPRSECCP